MDNKSNTPPSAPVQQSVREALEMAAGIIESMHDGVPSKNRADAILALIEHLSASLACDAGLICLDCQPRGPNGECPDAANAALEKICMEVATGVRRRVLSSNNFVEAEELQAIVASVIEGKKEKVV